MDASGRPITIIGTGLLGTSLALAIRREYPDTSVVGVARKEQTLEKARQLGAISRGTTDLAHAVREAKLVVVAVPLGAFDRVFDELGEAALAEDVVITDVGSAKGAVQKIAELHLPTPQRFVGSHPMAGNERQGPEAADVDLFQGKPCVICASDRAEEEAVGRVAGLWKRLGMRLLAMTPQEHDRKVAAVSHLPHLLAAMLVDTVEHLGGWDVASTGFASATRLARSNPPMRADIIAANRKELLAALTAFREDAQELHEMLERIETPAGGTDTTELFAYLVKQRDRHDQWLRDPDAAGKRGDDA